MYSPKWEGVQARNQRLLKKALGQAGRLDPILWGVVISYKTYKNSS